jgi:hypothetical protein
MVLKSNIGILAFDDGPHKREDLLHLSNDPDYLPRSVPLIGVFCHGTQLIHVSQSTITVDGTDATHQILEVYHNHPFRQEIRLIMIDSPTLAGFNPPNPFDIHLQTGIPVVLIPSSEPKSHIAEVYAQVFPDRTETIAFLQQLPPLESLNVHINADPHTSRMIYFHVIGASKDEIQGVLHNVSLYSAIPEPLRIAHIIASSLHLQQKI